jgi:hypothetical protein
MTQMLMTPRTRATRRARERASWFELFVKRGETAAEFSRNIDLAQATLSAWNPADREARALPRRFDRDPDREPRLRRQTHPVTMRLRGGGRIGIVARYRPRGLRNSRTRWRRYGLEPCSASPTKVRSTCGRGLLTKDLPM